MTPTITLRDQLKAVQEAVETARQDKATKAAARDQAKDAFAAAGVDPANMKEAPEFLAAEQAVKEYGEATDSLNDLQQTERSILGMLGEDAPAPDRNGNGPTDSPALARARGWNPEAIIEGPAYKALIEKGAPHSQAKLGAVGLGEIANREQAAAFFAGGQLAGGMQAAEIGSDIGGVGGIVADRRGIIQPNLKPLTLLDLFPVGTTDSNNVEYVQVVAIPGAAAETAEGDLKPEESFTTVDADAPVRTIAGWIKIRKQALADVAGLRTMLATLLPYDVKRRIESQMLVGNGVGQNLKGILNTTGIGAPEFVAGDNTADAILRAVTVIFLSDGDPNFVALHPLTWQDLLLMRENQAERTGAYLYGSPSMQVAPTIWGLAITNNRVVPAAQPLVGDSMAATVLVREGVNVLASDSDGDDFRRNRVTLLGEARVAFPIWRPSSFAVADTEA